MIVKRETLLNQLEVVRSGLSPREVIEQSSCFVFSDGKVMTYNDEIACSHESCVSLTGAVQAEPLVAVLSKMPGDEVEVRADSGELKVKCGGARQAGIRMENDILLPIDTVEPAGDWKELPDDFGDAVYIVSQCAGRDESQFVITCVHITPKYIEACDNYQLSRYPLKLPIKECLVRSESLKQLADMEMNEVSETAAWLHFMNPKGLVMSFRKTLDKYPKLSPLLEVDGTNATLPKGLVEATQLASVFSSENADNDSVRVDLTPKDGGKLRVTGDGASGWYKETKKLRYAGKPMKFRIAPKLLIELSKRHNECEISPSRLMVNGGKFKYVSCLEVADE